MTDYLLSQQGAQSLERFRLRLLQEYYDPLTVSQLDAIGVRDGWRCLDVGAGGGSVTQMLAERVGRTGTVLAVDLDSCSCICLALRRLAAAVRPGGWLAAVDPDFTTVALSPPMPHGSERGRCSLTC